MAINLLFCFVFKLTIQDFCFLYLSFTIKVFTALKVIQFLSLRTCTTLVGVFMSLYLLANKHFNSSVYYKDEVIFVSVTFWWVNILLLVNWVTLEAIWDVNGCQWCRYFTKKIDGNLVPCYAIFSISWFCLVLELCQKVLFYRLVDKRWSISVTCLSERQEMGLC